MDSESITGRTIKGYELRELIGEGGFGAVYRAYQPLVNREVAIKIILAQHANRPEFVRRFETEAQLVARLEHPFIVPLYDYWREPSGAYLVMRWLRGGSLQEVIYQHGPWSVKRVNEFLAQIGEALAVAHRQGVIHRDLKLENILLDENGNAFLTDFGIAKDLVGTNRLTQGDSIIGSPAYLSPEQIKGDPVKPQTDIYSLGIVLYELLTGQHPFPETTTPAALMYKQLSEPLPEVSFLRDDVGPEIDALIQKATAKEPDDRFTDVLALVREFRQIAKAAPGGEATVHPENRGGTLLVTTTGIVLPEPENPYKGLRAFQEADSVDFFGRESLVSQLIERLDEGGDTNTFLAVIGPSGSGKSSVIKAGVIPRLRQGALPGSQEWFVVEMVPGIDPFEEMEAALLRIAVNPPVSLLEQLTQDERGLLRAAKRVLPDDDTELILFIDQFEELFTLVEEEDNRQLFMDSLRVVATEPRSRVRVIVTLRADFYDRPLNYVEFGDLLRRRTEIVLPLSSEELESAIAGPARRVGMVLEPGLVTAIVSDVAEQPGALPLLQYALTELFERRDGHTLTLKAYEEIGRTLGALARRADELYEGLGAEGQQMTRQLFLRLVNLGEGTEDTRRRVLQSELLTVGDDPQVIADVVEAFGRYRLLTFDHDPGTRSATVEVAHEALIRQWKRLREWLLESREDLRTQRRVALGAEEWMNAKREPSFLARGSRLNQLEEWMSSTQLALTDVERAYLEASLAERERALAAERERQDREERLERRSKNQLRALVAVLAIAAVVALVLAGIALNESREATAAQASAERNAAEANALNRAANARNALIENNPVLAIALAREANAAATPAPVEVNRVLSTAVYAPGVRHRFEGHAGAVLGTAISPNLRYSASASADGSIIIWDNVTGSRITNMSLPDVLFTSVIFLDDSERIVAAGTEGTLAMWSITSGDILLRYEGHTDAVTSIATGSRDGNLLLLSGSLDKTLRVWSLETGELLNNLMGHTGVILDVAISDNGLYAASSAGDERLTNDGTDEEDRTVRVWDLISGTELQRFTPGGGYVRAIAFHPDSRSIIAGTWSGDVGGQLIAWDARTGRNIYTLYGHSDIITALAFSPDGSRLFSASWDRTLRVWDVNTGVEVQRFEVFNDRLLDVAVSADGQHALVATGNLGGDEIEARFENSIDTSVWLVDLRGRDEVRRFVNSLDWIWSLDISEDGLLAVSGSGPLRGTPLDTDVRLWNIANGEMIRRYRGHTATVEGVAISPDGSQILSGAWDGQIILWDRESGEEIRRFTLPEEVRVTSVAFHPNGVLAASSASDGSMILWDVAGGVEVQRFEGHEGAVNKIAFDAEGTRLASASDDMTVRVWDVESCRELLLLTGHEDRANDVTFSPDGSLLLSSAWDSTVRLWDLDTGELLTVYEGHNGPTFGLAFSPDGEVFVSGSADASVRMWDVATGQELRRLDGHTNWISEVQFTPDGRFVLSASQDDTMRLWQIARTAEEIIAWAEGNRYLRDLTCAEREQYRVEPLCDEQAGT